MGAPIIPPGGSGFGGMLATVPVLDLGTSGLGPMTPFPGFGVGITGGGTTGPMMPVDGGGPGGGGFGIIGLMVPGAGSVVEGPLPPRIGPPPEDGAGTPVAGAAPAGGEVDVAGTGTIGGMIGGAVPPGPSGPPG